MLELLQSIPGPYFLLFYAVLAFILIYLAKKIVENDGTNWRDLPDPTKMNPYAIALLAHETRGVIALSFYNLWKNTKIEIIDNEKGPQLKRLTPKGDGKSGPESMILDWIDTESMYLKDLLSRNFYKHISFSLDNVREELINQKLVPDPLLKERNRNIRFFVGSILLAIGGTKLAMGIIHERPSLFLCISLSISLYFLFLVTYPSITMLGKKFLKTSTERFEWIKHEKSDANLTEPNINLGIALFDLQAFADIPWAWYLAKPLLLQNAMNNKATGAGCGGAGCSGSDGGGGGGGGCGGCGGS
jgi:uncharacterized protein (TIGR04222 family)